MSAVRHRSERRQQPAAAVPVNGWLMLCMSAASAVYVPFVSSRPLAGVLLHTLCSIASILLCVALLRFLAFVPFPWSLLRTLSSELAFHVLYYSGAALCYSIITVSRGAVAAAEELQTAWRFLAYFRRRLLVHDGQLNTDDGCGDCVVCLDRLRPWQRLRRLSVCTHVFHDRCIGRWLSKFSTCPICRRRVHAPAEGSLLWSADPSDMDMLEMIAIDWSSRFRR